MLQTCDQGELNSISIPQFTRYDQHSEETTELKRNTDFQFDAQAFIWVGQLFQGFYNLSRIQPPKFGKAPSPVAQEKLVRRIYLVICDVTSYKNPPVFSKVLISNKFTHYYTQKVRPLKIDTACSKYISYINRDKSLDYSNPQTPPSSSFISNNIFDSDIGNDNIQRNPQRLLLKKLVQSLGDAIIEDTNSECGLSVIYPKHLMEEEESPKHSMPGTCAIGKQHGDSLESLDEYNAAFEFAKSHGYGIVEFADMTKAPRAKTTKKRRRTFNDADCMYYTSHNIKDERFSIKYKSKLNTISKQPGGLCSSTTSKGIPEDIDIVKKLRDEIDSIDIENVTKAKAIGERRYRSIPKKSKNNKRSRKNEKSKRYVKVPDNFALNKNEMGDSRSNFGNTIYNYGADDENELSTKCDTTFNTWNEFEKTQLTTVKNNNNDSINVQKHVLCDSNEGCSFDTHKADNVSEIDEQEQDDKVLQKSKDTKTSFWKKLRRPFKSIINKLKIFKKRQTLPVTKEQMSLKIEEMQISRVDYGVADNGKEIYDHTPICQNDADERDAAFTPKTHVIRHRSSKESDKRKAANCRPKPASLKNKTSHIIQMCGDGRRFFSCTNLTRDQKEFKSISSLDEYNEATSGDSANRITDVHDNKSHLLTSKTTANAHGDVCMMSSAKDENLGLSHQLSDQTRPCDFERVCKLHEHNKAHENNASLLPRGREAFMKHESEKMDNRASETILLRENHTDQSSLCQSQSQFTKEIEYSNNNTRSPEFFYNAGYTRENNFSTSKVDDADVFTESILSEDIRRFDVQKETIVTEGKNVSKESNCNNNAQDKEDDQDANHNVDQTFDEFPHVRYSQSRTTVRSNISPLDDDNDDNELENEIKRLVKEQDVENYAHPSYASRASGKSCTNENDPHCNQNSSKTIQRDNRATHGYCILSQNNPDRSYILSSPEKQSAEVSESFLEEHLRNNAYRQDDDVVSERHLGEEDEANYENNQEEMNQSETGYPPINLHQRNMVYCPTTENYWAQATDYPSLTNPSFLQNNSNPGHVSFTSCVDPMNEEIAYDSPQRQEAASTIEFYRLIDSCIAESENKLCQQLDNLYRTINERLYSLESMVNKQFDKTLSLIGNIKKQRGNQCMNNTDENNERISRSIHLNTEATKSNVPDNFSVKPLGHLSTDGSEGKSTAHNTFPSIAFTEVTPHNNHAHMKRPTEKADGDVGSSLSKHSLSDSKTVEKIYYIKKQSVKDFIKRNKRKSRSHQRMLFKKGKMSQKRRKAGNETPTKSRSSTQSRKMTCKVEATESQTALPQMTNLVRNSSPPLPYFQRQHSRKCRLRHRLTEGGSCSLCILAKGGKGTENCSEKKHSCKNGMGKGWKGRENPRSVHALVRKPKRTKRRKRNTEKGRGKCGKSKKLRYKPRRRKANILKKSRDKRNSSVKQTVASSICENVINDTSSKDQVIGSTFSGALGKQNNASHNNKTESRDKDMSFRKFKKLNHIPNDSDFQNTMNTKHRELPCKDRYHDLHRHKCIGRNSKNCLRSMRNKRKEKETKKAAGCCKENRKYLTKKAYKLCPRSDIITRRQRLKQTNCIVSKKQKRSLRGGFSRGKIKKTEKNICKGKDITKRKKLDKRCDKGRQSDLGICNNSCAYKRLMKEHDSLLWEVREMKQCLTPSCKDAIVVKREVLDKFNRLVSKCSHQRAHNLHRILFPRKRINDALKNVTNSSIDKGYSLFVCNPEHSNKYMVSNTDIFKRIPRKCNMNRIRNPQTFARNRILQHVDSLSLIRKTNGRRSNKTFDYSFRPIQAGCITSIESHCPSTQFDNFANGSVRKHQDRRREKEMKINKKSILFRGTDSHDDDNSRVVKWRDHVLKNTSGNIIKPKVNVNMKTDYKNVFRNGSEDSTASNSSQGSCCHSKGIPFISHVESSKGRHATYSWSKPICDGSDFTPLERKTFSKHLKETVKNDDSTYNGASSSNCKDIEMTKSVIEKTGHCLYESVAIDREPLTKINDQSSSEGTPYQKLNLGNNFENYIRSKSSSVSPVQDTHVSREELSIETIHDLSCDHTHDIDDEASNKIYPCDSKVRDDPVWHMKHPILFLRPRQTDSTTKSADHSVNQMGFQTSDNTCNTSSKQGTYLIEDFKSYARKASSQSNAEKENFGFESKIGNKKEKLNNVDMDREQSPKKSHSITSCCREKNNSSPSDSVNQSNVQSNSASTLQSASTSQELTHPDCQHHGSPQTRHGDDIDFINKETSNTHESIENNKNTQNNEINSISTKHGDEMRSGRRMGYVVEEDDDFEDENRNDKNHHLDNKTDERVQRVGDMSIDQGMTSSNESKQIQTQNTPCSSSSNFHSIAMSTNNNKVATESSSIAMNTTLESEHVRNQGYLLTASENESVKSDFCYQNRYKGNETDVSFADDEMSQIVSMQSESSRWTLPTSQLGTLSHNRNNDTNNISKADIQETLSVDLNSSVAHYDINIQRDNTSNELTENIIGSISEVDLRSHYDQHSVQLENDHLGVSSDPEEASSTSSGINNNNVTDNLINSQRQQNGASPIPIQHKRLECFTNCRFLPYNKYNCHCCCLPVKSMTTLHSEKTKLLQGMCLLGLSEAQEGCSHAQERHEDGESQSNGRKSRWIALKTRKRPLSTDSEEENKARAAKCCKKESRLVSVTKRPKTHFRRARWQFMREMKLNKLRNGSRRQLLPINRIVIAAPKSLKPPSSDADSESSL